MRPTACRYEHFLTDWYVRQRDALQLKEGFLHRKMWEWAIIAETLETSDMLRPGRKGLGFAVGTEPLPSYFAARGVEILATDFPEAGRWGEANQHAEGLESLFKADLVSEDVFRSRVTFDHADMNDIGHLPSEEFDFVWSSCAIEHVGSLDLSKAFVRNAMRLVKPGGLAIHSTEFNCSSNADTIEEGLDVIYRRRDIEELNDGLRLIRCGMKQPDFDCGLHPFDLDYDTAPFYQTGKAHLKILLGGYVATSFLLPIYKPESVFLEALQEPTKSATQGSFESATA